MKRPDNAVNCPKCIGTGRHTYADASGNTSHDDCERCDGKGWVTSLKPGEPGYDNDQWAGGEPPMRSIPRMTGILQGQGGERPELASLIAATRNHVMTDAEYYAQQRSWALGEYMLAHPAATRDEALQLVDDALKAAGVRKPKDEAWCGIHKVGEEMGELGQVLGKLGAFPSGKHPDGKGSLVTRAEEELADVEAAILYFREVNNLDPLPTRRLEKLQKFRKWGLSGVPI